MREDGRETADKTSNFFFEFDIPHHRMREYGCLRARFQGTISNNHNNNNDNNNNVALKVLHFEFLRDLKLIDEVPPWYSPVKPKPLYENCDVQAYCDIPVFAEQREVRANRVDATVINHRNKTVTTIEMSCPWIENRSKKDKEKTLKYGPLRWERNPLRPSIKLQILLLCFHTFLTEVVGRSC